MKPASTRRLPPRPHAHSRSARVHIDGVLAFAGLVFAGIFLRPWIGLALVGIALAWLGWSRFLQGPESSRRAYLSSGPEAKPGETLLLPRNPPPENRTGKIVCGLLAVVGLELSLIVDPPELGPLLSGIALFFVWLFCISSGRERIYLKLSPKGFTEANPLFVHTYRWEDVDCFFAEEGSGPERRVVFRVSGHYPASKLRRLIGALSGSNGDLTETYQMTPEDLAELLNEWRLRYGPKPKAKKVDIDEWV